MEWFDNIERKPSEIAFTEGLNRTIAYLMEYAEKRANKKKGGVLVALSYSSEERMICDRKCEEIIDGLQHLSTKEKFLVVDTLRETFLMEELKELSKVEK